MSTTTDMVPLSTGVSYSRPNYSVVEEQHMQQYQQSKYQPWSPESSQEPFVSNSNTKETATQSFKKHLTTKLAVSIFIGLVICGIPLAVMTTLYVQKKSSSNDSGNTGSSDNSVNLPTQCTTYTSNTDPTRLSTFTGCIGCFYDTSTYFPAGWYRFTGSAGTQLATTPPNTNTGSCGASYQAWYNGTYPSTSGSTLSSTVCVHVSGTLCSPSYPITISVTNCNGYYVYYLPSATISNIRYCTIP